MYHIPEVSVSVNGKEQIMSVLSRDLMSKRTIYLNGEINDEAALSIITQLHYLEDNSQEPITLVINSPGGCACSTSTARRHESAPSPRKLPFVAPAWDAENL